MHKHIWLMLLLGGCSLAPAYQRPETSLPPAFPVAATTPATAAPAAAPAASAATATPAASAAAATPAASAAHLAWQAFFADQEMQGWIEAALAHNRDLAQAVARVAAARAQYGIANAARLPAVSMNGAAARAHTPATISASGHAFTANQFSAGVSVPQFELDFWGRASNSSQAALHSWLATAEAGQAFRLSLIGQVASLVIATRAGGQQIDLVERALEARREGLAIAALRLKAGVTSTIDYDQARLLVTQAATELAELQRTTEQNHNLLRQLTGGVEPPRPPARQRLLSAAMVQPVAAGLPADLLRNRPDIRAAEHQLQAANANIGVARAAFLPSISLTAAGGFISGALADLLGGNATQWSAGSTLGLPLLDWGRRQAGVAQSRARADELAAAYQGAVQQALREVGDALVARQRYAGQIEAQREAVEAQRRLARTARLRYDNGIAIYLELLDAERSLFAAEQQLVSLRSAELQNDVSLYVALGGGTETAGKTP